MKSQVDRFRCSQQQRDGSKYIPALKKPAAIRLPQAPSSFSPRQVLRLQVRSHRNAGSTSPVLSQFLREGQCEGVDPLNYLQASFRHQPQPIDVHPGQRPSGMNGQDQEDQPAPVKSQPLCLNRCPVSAPNTASGSVFDAAGEVPNQRFSPGPDFLRRMHLESPFVQNGEAIFGLSPLSPAEKSY